MTAVFVHGVPELPALWDDLRARIDQDSVALSLPGFGSPRPADMRTNEDYAAWLAHELNTFDEPVHLVAHDWGAHLAIRAVSAYDAPVRSWLSDGGEAWHPRYQWHDGAQIIQSPEGKTFLAGLRKPNGSFEGFLRPRGISEPVMAAIDDAVDETTADTMYDLYRDATPNLYEYNGWGPAMAGAADIPGLIVAPDDDPFGNLDLSRETAERLNARFVVLPGKSHYWFHQDPPAAAALLTDFWSQVA